MSEILCILASCAAVGGTYALVLFGIDRLVAHRHTLVPVVRKQFIVLAVVASAAPSLVRVAKQYAETERRLRLEGRR